VRIEKKGRPTVLVSAPAFKEEVISHSALHGLPYLPYVVVDYDQEFLPIIPKQTEKVFDKMVKALTTPAEELQKNIPGEII
jgi:hypothetical protein